MRLADHDWRRARPLLLALVPLTAFVIVRLVGAPVQSIRAVALTTWLFLIAAAGVYEAGKRADSRLVGVGLIAFILGVVTIVVPTSHPLIGLAAVVLMLVPMYLARKRPGASGPYR